MKHRNFTVTILLFAAIVLVINLLAEQFFFRIDLTENRQYTLSPATRDILRGLEDPITVKAYFSKDIPAQLIKTRNDFREMLVEYGKISGGMVVYEFISPNENEEAESEAMKNGIQPVMINVREKDQMKQQRAYMGAVLSLGDRKEIIPVVEPGLAMEYTLSTAIKKLAVTDKPVIGFLTGHGEASKNHLVQVNDALSVLYEVEDVRITDTTGISSYIQSLCGRMIRKQVDPGDVWNGDTAQLDGVPDLLLHGGGDAMLVDDEILIHCQAFAAEAVDMEAAAVAQVAALNGIDWLSDDTGLIELRTKGVSSRPIKQMEDGTRTLVKWLNFLLPVLLVLVYGLIRYQYRKSQRIRRMEADFS